jgi:hypothetical protein
MQSRDKISRRKVMKMVGMAGGLAMAARLRNVYAQAATHVELLDPSLDRIISQVGTYRSKKSCD